MLFLINGLTRADWMQALTAAFAVQLALAIL